MVVMEVKREVLTEPRPRLIPQPRPGGPECQRAHNHQRACRPCGDPPLADVQQPRQHDERDEEAVEFRPQRQAEHDSRRDAEPGPVSSGGEEYQRHRNETQRHNRGIHRRQVHVRPHSRHQQQRPCRHQPGRSVPQPRHQPVQHPYQRRRQQHRPHSRRRKRIQWQPALRGPARQPEYQPYRARLLVMRCIPVEVYCLLACRINAPQKPDHPIVRQHGLAHIDRLIVRQPDVAGRPHQHHQRHNADQQTHKPVRPPHAAPLACGGRTRAQIPVSRCSAP